MAALKRPRHMAVEMNWCWSDYHVEVAVSKWYVPKMKVSMGLPSVAYNTATMWLVFVNVVAVFVYLL